MRNYSHSPRFRSCHYPRKLDVLIASQIRVGGAVSGGGLRAKSHNDGNVPFPRPRRHLFLPHPYLSPLPPPPASSPPSLPPSLISEKKKINITYLAFANVTRHHSQPKEHKAVSVPTTTQTNDADVRAAAEPRCLPPAFAKEQRGLNQVPNGYSISMRPDVKATKGAPRFLHARPVSAVPEVQTTGLKENLASPPTSWCQFVSLCAWP